MIPRPLAAGRFIEPGLEINGNCFLTAKIHKDFRKVPQREILVIKKNDKQRVFQTSPFAIR